LTKTNISVIILTFNEELHIERCIKSLSSVVSQIFIIDSFSTDNTVSIATKFGAKVYQNKWINYAAQFQWGLDNCPITTEWVMRMDADEYITPELGKEIIEKLGRIDMSNTGILLKRQVHFMGRWIKHGGYYPIKLLRIWRNGVGSIEKRWMDEHIKLSHGKTIEFQNDLVDNNLNNLSWWTEKHNSYATREAIDLMNKKYNLFKEDTINKSGKQQDEKKRWYKDNLYARSPRFLRVFLYFIFRYILLLGFLDGKPGLIWHVLQGFWYRFLVDAKITQIIYLSKQNNKSIQQVLEDDYGVKL
jgi:glycosyltransferase involved in cell wall biosynthesis